jgi:hypothetical protein
LFLAAGCLHLLALNLGDAMFVIPSSRAVSRDALVMMLLLLLAALYVSLECSAAGSVELVDQEVSALGIDSAGCLRSVIGEQDLALLGPVFSSFQLTALYDPVPITSWPQLFELKYSQNYSTYSVCSESKALFLRFLFDLEGAWPWANEARIDFIIPKTSLPGPTIDELAQDRGFDQEGIRSTEITAQHVSLLSLFLPEDAVLALIEVAPIDSWRGVLTALCPISTGQQLERALCLLRLFFRLPDNHPWPNCTPGPSEPGKLTLYEPRVVDVRRTDDDDIRLHISIVLRNYGGTALTGVSCHVWLEVLDDPMGRMNLVWDQERLGPYIIDLAQRRELHVYLVCPSGVNTRVCVDVWSETIENMSSCSDRFTPHWHST